MVWTRLHFVTCDGKLEEVQNFVSQGDSVNEGDGIGNIFDASSRNILENICRPLGHKVISFLGP